MALENMYKKLGWSTKGIRDMTKGQASDAFKKCEEAFRSKDNELDLSDPYEDREYGAYKQS
jgi:hypothetical protein